MIDENQLKEIIEPMVRQILAEMLGVQSTPQPQRQWYDTDPAYSLLGLDYSDQLRDLVRSGILRIGIEVRDVRSPNSQIPRYQFHLEKCESRLLTPPEKRRIKKIA
ncbi:hypothetical protein [Aulosira sp. FACHB-615]|uniref:hypothetical protein n=1 Tax=Aulosira sp. FACHB-615 TaxID=2692777 RepID=UPI0016826B7A|nr:hypothetical protein [Aulosira sp. FACHB-615]